MHLPVSVPVRWVALAASLRGSLHRAGSSPRRASNFSLSRQKKVTKEEALNRKSPLAGEGHRAKTAAQSLTRGEPLRSRCCPCHQPDSSNVRAPNVGCTPNSRGEDKRRRRRVPACGAFADKPGVQPALNVVKARVLTLVQGGPRERSGSLLGTNRANVFAHEPHAPARGCAVQRLSFGDFSLARQRKVTRPPGRTPGTVHRAAKALGKSNPTLSAD
jgi:hypothetical protein